MSLTEPEALAAVRFRREQREALEARNAAAPPDFIVSVFTGNYRHQCKDGRSVFLEMREHYVRSPMAFAGNPPEDPSPGVFVPEGRFAFIWTEGRCSACGKTARSWRGRLVDTVTRPPAPRAIAS